MWAGAPVDFGDSRSTTKLTQTEGDEIENHIDRAGEHVADPPTPTPAASPLRGSACSSLRLDPESRSWWFRLHGKKTERDGAIAELHERLRREALFHLRRRARVDLRIHVGELDDLAVQAAGDALLAVLRKLDQFRGESRFWTWARRFAELEVPVAIRRTLAPDHLAADPELTFAVAAPGSSPHERAVAQEELRTVTDSIVEHLSERQRRVLIAVAVDGVSPAALAFQLDTSPGAIYKTVHDARKKLTAHLLTRDAA